MEAGALELRAKLALRVAADFAAKRRMIAFQYVERGNVDHGEAAGPEDPEHFLQRRLLGGRFEAVEHVERQHDVERRVREGQVRHAALYQSRQTAIVPESDSAPEQLEAERGAVLLEQRKVRAGAAAGVEQSRIRSSGRGFFDERRNETFEAAKPEMPLFGLKRALEQRVHVPAF